MKLLRSLDELSADWLSEVLHVPVAGFRIEREIHGTATKAKLALDYADHKNGGNPPATLWLKAGMEPHSTMMAAAGIYEHEARFYAELRPQLDLTAPRSWFAGLDSATQNGVLLIEDLDALGARFFSTAFLPTLDHVRSVLDQLARLHAKWWDSPYLDASGWLETTFTPDSPGAGWYRRHGVKELAHYMGIPRGDAMPPVTRDPARIIKAFWTLVDHMGEPPRCLLHGDAHFGNSYVLPDGQCGYVDWQTPRKGCWAHDVAYYLGSALSVEDRRRYERTLLTEYFERLAEYGGRPPRFDTAWFEYRRNMPYGLMAWLCNPEADGFQPEALNVLCVERFSAAVADLDSYATLSV